MIITNTNVGKYGRAGNQFFQVAACIGYAAKYKRQVVLSDWFCTYTKKNMALFFENQLPFSKPNFTKTYNEPHFHYAPIPEFRESLNLHGYFQSEKYFEHCADQVRHYFTPRKNVEQLLQKKYPDLSDTCSIHIRRGDYVNHPLHEVCNLDYYKRAIAEIERRTTIRKFVVFSDDIQWCRNNLRGQFEFVDGNHDIEDIFLMSMCTHHIIANSSFSWWGSWLNKNPNKIILAPSAWFNNSDMIQTDVYTKDMIKI